MKNNLRIFSLLSWAFLFGGCAHGAKTGASPRPTTAQAAIQKMTGCYLVDYSYVETEALKKGYQRDPRVYDVNKGKASKEWIYAEEISPSRLRLQHVLFATDGKGVPVAGSELKHQAEDWEYEAPYVYEYTGPSKWKVVEQPKGSQKWTRRITNLDDGLRYQCASPWKPMGLIPNGPATIMLPFRAAKLAT